jgi:hypothetical protein
MAEQQELDLKTLANELRDYLDYDAAYKMERLIHTHVGGPMTTVFTQMQITEIIMKRNPDELEAELVKLKDNISAASANIRTIVRALAMASRDEDEDENEDDD